MMEVYVHLTSICMLLCCVSRALRAEAAEELCDAQFWYMDLFTEGPLSGSVHSAHQRAVHSKIKAFMAKLKRQGQGFQVACSHLQTLEDILSGEPEDHGGASKSSRKPAEEKSSREDDLREKSREDSSTETVVVKTEKESVGRNEGDSRSKTGATDSKDSAESDASASGEKGGASGERMSRDGASQREGGDDSKEDRSHGKPEEGGDGSETGSSAEDTEQTDPTEVDETELSEDSTEPEENSKGDSGGEGSTGDPSTANDAASASNATVTRDAASARNVTTASGTAAATDVASVRDEPSSAVSDRSKTGNDAENTTLDDSIGAQPAANKTPVAYAPYRLILQGVSLENRSHIIEVFRYRKTKPSERMRDIWNTTCTANWRSKPVCNYLRLLRSVCEVLDAPLAEKRSSVSHVVSAEVQKACKNSTHVCSPLCFYAFENRQCLQAYGTHRANGSVLSARRQKERADSREKYDESSQESSVGNPNDESVFDSSEKETEENRNEDGNGGMQNGKSATRTNVEEGTTESDLDSRQSLDKREKRKTDELGREKGGSLQDEDVHFQHNSEGIRKTVAKEMEKVFQQQASQYASKIQSLELMVSKLENQVLMERLTQQNDTAAMSRLETQILRLENQLLKLSQSHAQLHEEHERTRRLGLDHVTQSSPSNVVTPEVSQEQQQLITQQQARLLELRDVLKNHSAMMDKLQSKTETLEEQNQLLFQTVLNQSALIASILGQLQQLGEANARRRQETSALQSQMALRQSSDTLFARIETLVASAVEGRGESADQPGSDTAGAGAPKESGYSSRQKMEPFLPTVPVAGVPAWHCDGNNSTRVCFAFSVILTPCPPFSTVHWSPCPFYVADMSEKGLKQRPEAKGSRPQAVDARPVGQNGVSDGLESEEAAGPSDENNEATEEKDESKGGAENSENDSSRESKSYPKSVDGKVGSSESHPESNQVKEKDEKEKVDEKSPSTDSKPSTVVSAPQESESFPKCDDDPKQVDSKEDEKSSSEKANSQKDDAPARGEEKKIKEDNKTVKKDNEESERGNTNKKISSDPKRNSNTKADGKKKSSLKIKKVNIPVENPEERKILYADDDNEKPKDCWDHYQRGRRHNGVYRVHLLAGGRLQVYCDMRGGGWTVLLKRQDGSLDFYRSWDDYKKGFGDELGEYYIGNDNLHQLTNQDRYRLSVDLWDWSFQRQKVFYQHFWVEDENEAYRLHIYGHQGEAPDGLLKHNLMKFSTYDRDNDLVTKEFKDFGNSCARRFHGAGWYYKCYASNIFGLYYRGGDIPEKRFDGVTWKSWTGPNYSLKEVILKIRPESAEDY